MQKLKLDSVIIDIKSIVSQDPSTIRRIGVFGSLARQETHEKSDIDIAIEYETKNYSFDNFVKFLEVCEHMEDMLSGKYKT
jgi:predicted nucleotidyltransferase